LSKFRTVTIEVAVQIELDKINHLSSAQGGISEFPGFLFPVPGKSLVEGVSAKSSHYSCRKNFFLGKLLER
jgi:hypothetical protein